MKEFEYNDFVKWSDIFLALSYTVNIFHESTSAIYSFRNAFAFEKSSFLSVIAGYSEEGKKVVRGNVLLPTSLKPLSPCTLQPKCSMTSFRQESQ